MSQSLTKVRWLRIRELIDELYSDTKEIRRDQIDALEDIASHCTISADAIREDLAEDE